jgi:hypothetical protein
MVKKGKNCIVIHRTTKTEYIHVTNLKEMECRKAMWQNAGTVLNLGMD